MTVISLSTFRAQVDGLLSASNAELAQHIRDIQIKAAIHRYNGDNPLLQADDVTGDGGNYYVIPTVLSSWVEGASRILDIGYPAAVVASDDTPQYLGREDWQDDFWAYGSGTLTRHLYFPSHAPAATETFRVSYNVPYGWTAGTITVTVKQATHGLSLNDPIYYDGTYWRSAETSYNNLATHSATTITDANNFTATELRVDIPQQDFFAICYLAAGLICQALATKYSRTSDSTLSLDSVNHTPRAAEFAARAREYLALYNEHLGIGAESEDDIMAFGAFGDWDAEPTWPAGRRYLFHGPGVR